jgi:hypothetical protein
MPLTLNGTTGIAGANGSASTPAVQGEDTNTGVFFPAADTIAFAEGGAEVARFDASGNFGVGETSPTFKMEVKGTNPRLAVKDAGGTYFLRLVASGSFAYSGLEYKTLFTINDDATERARIDSSGNLLVGTTSTIGTGARVQAAAPQFTDVMALQTNTTALQGIVRFYNPNGAVGNINTNGSATAYVTSSDYRLKENVQPMQDALAKIAQLNPVTYTWKVDGSDGQGFIAHELQAVVPDCVSGEKDAVDAEGNPQYQGVDTSFLVATLVKAVQELKAEVDSLKAQLEAAQ